MICGSNMSAVTTSPLIIQITVDAGYRIQKPQIRNPFISLYQDGKPKNTGESDLEIYDFPEKCARVYGFGYVLSNGGTTTPTDRGKMW